MSHDSGTVKLAKWPFYLADLILSGVIFFVLYQLGTFEGTTDTIIVAICLVVAGIAAWISVVPWLKEHDSAVHLTDSSNLKSSVEQIKSVEKVADLIRQSNAQWQSVQDSSARTVTAAQEISDRMKAEADEFMKFLGRAHEQERTGLRLEVEKLRRMEGDWIKVTVQMLDHIYAIFRAAERSGQQTLITQLGQFQNACRDVARRMGLAPFMPVIGEAFDARAHQLPDPKMQGNEGAAIQDVMACGYTYQGQLLRRALVVLEGGGMSSQPEAFPGGQEEPSAIGDPNQIHPEPTVAAEEFQRQSPQEPIRELGDERAETTSESQPERVSEVFEEVEISERIVDEEESVTQNAPEETSGKADAVEEAAPRRSAKKKSPQDELPF